MPRCGPPRPGKPHLPWLERQGPPHPQGLLPHLHGPLLRTHGDRPGAGATARRDGPRCPESHPRGLRDASHRTPGRRGQEHRHALRRPGRRPCRAPPPRTGGLFPPTTREVQLDEKWAFVSQKEKSCDPLDPLDRLRGDDWDHTAVDPESRLRLALVPGKRDGDACKDLVPQVHNRTAGRTDLLITSDEHAPYETAIKEVSSVERPRPKRPGPGRPPKPERILPADLCYATVRKTRAKGRVVEVVRTLVFGTMLLLGAYLWRSRASTTVNTSFVERHNGTDRHQNSRKHRKTYGFSKDIEVHHAASYFIGYSYNFCWCVRTLRVRGEDGSWQQRTPAMAAGLTGHVWSLWEWITYPARPR